MKKNKKKEYDDDDGIVIAPMDIEGMPWYNEKSKSVFAPKKRKPSPEDELQLSKKEHRAMMGGVFAAALLVAGVFAVAALLFILFCVYVWFR